METPMLGPGEKTPKDLGNVQNSRSSDQAEHMRNTVGQGKCPFCPDGFDAKKNVVVPIPGVIIVHWQAWFNPFPYHGTKTHIIIAAVKHWTDIGEITPDAWREWAMINEYFIKVHGLAGGGIVMRFGENKLNGGTLSHVHSHIMVPDEEDLCIAVFFKTPKFADYLMALNAEITERKVAEKAALELTPTGGA